jgi:hypothetical protein
VVTHSADNDNSDRLEPLGPHEQIVVGWLDDNGALLPDPAGLPYRRTFTDWIDATDRCICDPDRRCQGWQFGQATTCPVCSRMTEGTCARGCAD